MEAMRTTKLSEIWPIEKLKLWEENPRSIMKKDFERLKRQIQKFGVYKPLIITPDGMVIGGNMRLRALQELGYKEVWVSVVKPKSKAEMIEISLSDNDRVGWYDDDRLAELIYPIKDEINLDDYSIDLKLPEGLDELISNYAPDTDKDNEVPEPPKKATTKPGDLYILGGHRLLCGDSTKKEDVERLMDGKKADMVFTDPPYGINLDTDWSGVKSKLKFYREKRCKGQGTKYDKVIGDNVAFDPTFLLDFFKDCREIFLWGADYYFKKLPDGGSLFVWDKRSNEGDDLEQIERFDKQIGSCFEICWSKNKHRREIVRCRWSGIFGTEKEPDENKSRLHPTQKPVLLCEWFIGKFSKQNVIIVDLFGGSGSTMIACEKLGRKCYMMEIDPIYCDIIVNRWQNFTGKKAKKING